MALVDVLDFIPKHEAGRDSLLAILDNVAVQVKKLQDPKTGGWYQVMDRSGDKGNYLESSCSAMFIYSLFKAVRMGYIDPSYLDVAKTGYEGFLKNFIEVDKDGATYEYPLCMTAHCMAINKTVFEEADAMQYVDAENHTWTTDDFFKAMDAVYAHTGQTVGAVYCSGQGGDQGTRALINNLYGGTFTDADHTKYTADSAENVKAIQALVDSKAIGFDASIAGGDEINLFRQGVLNVAFCWNIAQQLNADNNDAGLTNDGDEILFMAFPSEKATDTKLCGGIWGFGVFDNKDANKIEASKLFIKYMADSAEGTPDAVLSSTYFPVRDTVEGKDLTGLYGDVQTMSDYSTLMQYLGDYYQVTPGWAEARTAWWNMLQQVGSGADVQTAVDEFVGTANAAAAN